MNDTVMFWLTVFVFLHLTVIIILLRKAYASIEEGETEMHVVPMLYPVTDRHGTETVEVAYFAEFTLDGKWVIPEYKDWAEGF